MTLPALKKTFYSNGKLFLIGEYTVIDGSDAFALPTSYGQYLDIEENDSQIIEWKSYDANGGLWFHTSLSFESIYTNTKTGDGVTDTLTDILHSANALNPNLLKGTKGFKATTRLTFSRNWGLGSSSTLINNIAQWFQIDAYNLLQQSFGGSGYDIACAQHDTPIIYNMGSGEPTIKAITFTPPFLDKLYFVYLNQKQNTRSSVLSYREKVNEIPLLIKEVNNIIAEAQSATDFDHFCNLLNRHSALMSKALQLETVKNSLFPDFNGTVKSLGAWGGDFVLAATNENPEAYFKSKGFETIIPYSEMILSQKND